MSTLNPTPENILEWLRVVEHPETPEARVFAKQLITGAWAQSEESNVVLAREVVNLRAQVAEQRALMQRCHELLGELFPGAAKPVLTLVRSDEPKRAFDAAKGRGE